MLAVVKRHLHEPKGAMTHGEMLDDFRAQGNLNALDGGEEQLAQGIVELIEGNSILKCGTGLN